MTTPVPDQTKRRNEPVWEPVSPKWYGAGNKPPPGLYWFEGFVNLSIEFGPPMEGRFVVLVLEDGWINGWGTHAQSAFRAVINDLTGEWFGPFECPPWFGETLDGDEDKYEPPSETV